MQFFRKIKLALELLDTIRVFVDSAHVRDAAHLRMRLAQSAVRGDLDSVIAKIAELERR